MPSENTEHRKLAAIMFTDMVGYSAMAQRDEALALELLEEHRALLRGLFPKHQGTEIKTTGDGFLVEFASALAAVRCAVEIQQTLAERNKVQPSERRVRLRIGIHLGDVVHSENDVHGDGVNIAARLEPLAQPGGICVSDDVVRQIRNKVSHPLVSLGPAELKNIELPMVVHRVVLPWEESSSSRREEARTFKSEIRDQRSETKKTLVTSTTTKYVVAAVLLMFVCGLGWWLVQRSRNEVKQTSASSPAKPLTSATTSSPNADQKSIAVLPFVSMSADKADEYLSDGMTEELLNALTKVPGLRVPGRSSSFAFKGKTEDGIFRKVGEQLHVATVLEGSVRKAGEKVRITAQLINVADGFHLWSETYDGDMKDILSVQSDVAQRVVQALRVKLEVETARALTTRPTENPEAHRLYLLGRYSFAKNTGAELTNAMQYFNQAVRLDPSYALAYCGLADIYGWMGGFQLSGKEAWAKEKELAQKALVLDPNLADAHLSLGIALVSAFNWNVGEQEIKRALSLNGKLALAYDQLAWVQAMFGQFDAAIDNQQKAVDLDPFSPLLNHDLGQRLFCASRHDEAIAQYRKTLELAPNLPDAHCMLGWCYYRKGDTTGAIAEFQKAKSLEPEPYFDAVLAYAYARAGDRAKAEQLLHTLEDLAKERYISPELRVRVHLGLGEKDKALDWLDKCYEEQDAACWNLKVDPLYDPVRNEPRFQALLKKVGLDK